MFDEGQPHLMNQRSIRPRTRKRFPTVPLVIALSLAGVWICGSLLKGHHGGWRLTSANGDALAVPCASRVLPDGSCSEVTAGRWGSFDLFVGARRILLPTSLLGLVYFVFMAIWFAMVGPPDRWHRWMWRLLVGVLLSGSAFSVFLMVVMASSVSQGCPACVTAHLLNLAIVVTTLISWRRVRKEKISGIESVAYGLVNQLHRKLALSALTVSIVAGAASWLYFDAITQAQTYWRKHDVLQRMVRSLQKDREFVLREFYAQPVHAIQSRDRRVGDPPAARSAVPAELVVFTDYNARLGVCFEAMLAHFVANSMSDHVRVHIRQLPAGLDRSDPKKPAIDDAATVVSSIRASLAAEAARQQGGDSAFATMHRLLYEFRKDRPHRNYAKLAKQAGLNVYQLIASMNSRPVRQTIERDAALAAELGVETAPAAFLNGRRVPPLCLRSETFWQAMAADLATQATVASTTKAASPQP